MYVYIKTIKTKAEHILSSTKPIFSIKIIAVSLKKIKLAISDAIFKCDLS